MENDKKLKNFIREILNENNYRNHTTCVIALFFNKKLLILQRGNTAPWMPNKWSLVGGILDKGETETEAIIREVKEEISLPVRNVKLIQKLKTNDIGDIVYFTGNLDTDEIKLDYENQTYRFIDIKEIDNFDFVPNITDFIKSLF